MKTLKFLLSSAVALMALAGCEKEKEAEHDDYYYAQNATISSSDNYFTTADGIHATISFKASGGEVVINVDCGAEWTAENDAEDIFGCTIQSKSVTITAGQNVTGEELTGTITLMTAESKIEFAIIEIIQSGQAYVTLGTSELFLSSFGSTVSVAVESNYDWDYSYDTSNGWFSVEKDEEDSSLSIRYHLNATGSDREGVVTVTAGDGEKNVAEGELKITQSCENFDALIFELTITKNNVTVALPIPDNSNVVINWDAENQADTDLGENVRSVNSHTYSTPGIYIVTVNRDVSKFDSYKYGSNFQSTLTAVKQWGNTGFTTMSDAFYGCTSLTTVPENMFSSCKEVRSFSGTFCNCSSLVSAPSFEGLSSVTTFELTFDGCSSMTNVPENMFSGCTAATRFRGTFYKCSSLTAAPEKMFSGCTAATTFEETFYNCSSLVSAPSFEGCSAATTFEETFYGCTALTTVPENMFSGCTAVTRFYDTFYNCSSLVSAPSFGGCSSATTFGGCFSGCEKLTTIPENMFSGCTAVTSFNSTFYNCSSLVSAPSFEGCSSATSFQSTFHKCTSLTTIPKNMFSGCSATSFASAFYDCTKLTTIPENMFSGCTAVTTFYRTFYNCSSLKTVPVGLFDDTLLVTDFGSTFYGCSSVIGESPYTEKELNGEKVRVHLYERSDYAVEMRFSIPTTYSSCFKNSTFSDIDSIPSKWGGNGN